MLSTGLVSITFRRLSPREIIDLVARAGLEGIEWGGDVHVPHGALSQAEAVARATEDAGLKTVTYGSYYYGGHGEAEGLPFERVLETARELQAPNIRVWAGRRGSNEADPGYRKSIVEESRRIADMAGAAGITISFEFHGGTLLDTGDSAAQFLDSAAHANIRTHWQPPVGADLAAALRSLQAVLPWLGNVHVFHWGENANRRHLLEEGADSWRAYLDTVRSTGREHFCLLEFVKDNDPMNFLQDARTLKRMLGENTIASRRSDEAGRKNEVVA